MKVGAFRPRRPPLPHAPGTYTMEREGYPTNPLQPIPIMSSGYAVNSRPYPSRDFPNLPMADEAPVTCPPGMRWSVLNRSCVPIEPTAHFKGLGKYGGYLSPEIAKVWQWDSFAVGMGCGAAAMTLGIAASLIIQGSHKKGRDPKVDMSLIPSLIPGIGAAVIGYLLRYNMNTCCPCEEGPSELRAAVPSRTVTATAGACPEGWVMTPRGCEELI